MSREEHQAQHLAEWLESPSASPPKDLDPDVLEGLYALRPDLAPPPRLSASDILDDLLEGPLALPAPDLLAATAMADWLESGGEAPDGLDDDVIEGISALKPELAAPPSLTASDILASLDTPVAASPSTPPVETLPANNHRWFLLGAAGGSGLLAVAAAALFTVTVTLHHGADESPVAVAEPSQEEAEPEAPSAAAPSAAPRGQASATAAPTEEADAASSADQDDALFDRSKRAESKQDAAAELEPSPDPTPDAGLSFSTTTTRGGDDLSTADGLQSGGSVGVGGLSAGRADAGGALSQPQGNAKAEAARPTATQSPRPKPKSRPTAQPEKPQSLAERFPPPPEPPAEAAPTTTTASVPTLDVDTKVSDEVDEVAVADLFGSEDTLEDDGDYALGGEAVEREAMDVEPASRSYEIASGPRSRDRVNLRRSKRASNMASAPAPAEMDAEEQQAVSESPVDVAPAQPSPANPVLRAQAAAGVGTVQRRAGNPSEVVPPQASGEPVAIHLAEAAMARGDYPLAQQYTRAGLSLGGANTPERAWLYVLDGDAAASQGDTAGAERSWREAIRLNSTRSAPPASDSNQLMSTPD